MALANVAWIIAASGKRVLVVDWDLEAPGLQRYFSPFLLDKELACSDGVINFVNSYKLKAMTPPPEGQELSPDWYVKYADIRNYAVAVKWPAFPGEGRLDFLTAGRQDETYSGLVSMFNWQDFYERLGGSQFLDAAAQIMRRHYDYILIDSRTGVSDTSGICTVKMPDALVVCFTLNYQGIDGAAAVADHVASERLKSKASAATTGDASSASSNGLPEFNIFPVPMRLENAEKQKLQRRRDYARRVKFAKYPIYLSCGSREDYWDNVPLLYDSYYAYEEILATFGETERDVTSFLPSIERLTSYLTDGSVQQLIPLPQSGREEVLKLFEGTALEPDEADIATQAAEQAFSRLTPPQQEAARSVFLRLTRIARPDEVDGKNSRQLVNLREFEGEARRVIQVLSDFQLLQIRPASSQEEEAVQIAQESLLQGWERLHNWIEKDKDFLYWRQEELRPAAIEWDRARGVERLLQPYRVTGAWQHIQRSDSILDFNQLEREFIRQSLMSRASRESETGSAPPDSFEQLSQVANQKREYEDKARLILRGESPLSPDDMLALAKGLMQYKSFTDARRILGRAILDSSINDNYKLRLKIHQQAAVCTYKDMDLPADLRLDRALELLRSCEDLSTTKNQETLGITGAIYKRKWEVDSQRQQLERSLSYYLRGCAEGVENDQGYTGINAAFVLDLLAHQEEEEAKSANVPSESARERRAQAKVIREEIIKKVSPLIDQPDTDWLTGKWWFYSTVAEAYFGLGTYSSNSYDLAVHWLQRGATEASPPEWEYETTVRQLAALARLQSKPSVTEAEIEFSPAWQALKSFFGEQTAAVSSALIGKIGLGLSGGGFRASLYHIGVLAKLAELDVLRRVEVLSCVSGGSIIGAHYYLEVRQLLQTKADHDITREDYIEIVKRIQDDFLAGVQTNIRVRVAAEFLTNLKMIFWPGYSRTMRAGELYERDIFSRVKDGEGERERWLNELLIHPVGEPNFTPKNQNWRRLAKVPILILNATTLNTGHTWQFTAQWMGEPPAGIDSSIDGNDRYRRMYYTEAPDEYKRVRLGYAVAASSCVPGLFEPLALERLFPGRTVRLVDGGTCDNQGVGGLLEQDCNVMLISDASGQMGSEDNPSKGLLGVPLRSLDIVQSRVRAAQYDELSARKRSALLRGFMFIHLKSDLDVDPIDWVDCHDPFDASDDARPMYRRGTLTNYGISKSIQGQLAAIRTDLDSFSDVEAYALMTSGYRMTEQAFDQKCVEGFDAPKQPEIWKFLNVEDGMRVPGKQFRHVQKLLGVSGNLAFKIWLLSTPLRILAVLLGIALILLSVFFFIHYRNNFILQTVTNGLQTFTLGAVGLALLMLILTQAATMLFGKTFMRVVHYRSTLIRIGIGIGMAAFGCLLARLHLHVFDKMFLSRGSLDNFKQAGRGSLEEVK